MNVFGRKARSWRKGRKRGVSPIIATILLVAITVVLAAVLYILISGLTKGPGNTPLGSAWGWGSTSLVQPTANQMGCKSGDFCYQLTITPSSGLTAAGLTLRVDTATGAFLSNVVFSFVNVGQTSCLLAAANPSTSWAPGNAVGTTAGGCSTTTAGTLTSSTPLASTMTLWIDLGTTNPTGQGDQLTAFGTGSFQGSVGPLTLP